MRRQRYNLIKIIYDDLCIYGKIQLFLLLLIMVSAILVIVVTYQTKYMIVNYEKLLLETDILDREWNGLILEKRKLFNHIRVEDIATSKLQMRYADPLLDSIYE